MWVLLHVTSGWGANCSSTYRCGDEDKQGISIDTHRLQEGISTDLALSPLSPGQKTPDTQRHKPRIEEHHNCCYGHWKHTKRQHIKNVFLREMKEFAEQRSLVSLTRSNQETINDASGRI